ncbi:DNA-directed RNA polymerase I subunit RPA2-like [Asterias rubens]|uniref:DNA-directed RNA polymerase I subunit RPA2-like n=1 Tax=Asterias rubens TaxID=7604 RepID=UPI0014559F94|nr:DNA-directed RNA polymerase I subunit RPA2-like [Asterias rubens]
MFKHQRNTRGAFSKMAAPSFNHLQATDYGRVHEKQHVPLQELTRPHIESFNYFLQEGLALSARQIPPVEFTLGQERVSLAIRDAIIGAPEVSHTNRHAATLRVFPSECRQRGTTYRAKIQASVSWASSSGREGVKDMLLGDIPIMVKSDKCNLNKMSPAQLIQHQEEAEEMGGYFIVNGIERVIRMLVMPRRNYPMAVNRPRWKTRGRFFTEFGVTMRCVQNDQTSGNLILHYLNNGSVVLSFTCLKEMFFISLVTLLKALVDTTDQHIYHEILKGKEDDTFLIGCVTEMLRHAQAKNLTTQQNILDFMGEQFRNKLRMPEWYSTEKVAKFLLKQHICVHLDSHSDKFNALILMARKLFFFARGHCASDNLDSPMNQEVLLAGHLYQMVLKEKMQNWLVGLRYALEKKATNAATNFILNNASVSLAVRAVSDLTKPMEYLLATGNLASKTGLGLMQASGLTVVADKLNFMRFVSHFRCIHRGSFFAQMRTTSVRKLLPEAWGFLCPVHTPDGAPCGLMNHLSASCQVTNTQPMTSHLPRLLANLGMAPLDGPAPAAFTDCYEVVLDGRVVGMVAKDVAPELAKNLGTLKAKEEKGVPATLEIVLVPKTKHASEYPGLFLFSTPARLMRPVFNLATQSTHLIGSFEQVYMNIAVTRKEIHEGITTHLELSEGGILSAVASLTPFSDFNQSPRNMYQCQMGKQTMGTPAHTLQFRNDHKMYRLQTPQSPLVRPHAYDNLNFDDYPLGTNAVVAVISYTGYDMEDAMILNKSSVERGFAHGTIYKTEEIDLRKKSDSHPTKVILLFGSDMTNTRVQGKLDIDGLPPIGTVLEPGDPFYSMFNVETRLYKVETYKGMETAVVDNIKVTGTDFGLQECQKAYIQLRIQRNPIIGDKFSSRHGQKGICSQRWPTENMPFTESGMTPDILFNPHGFPSRMTIGMMIESMAGKSSSLHGMCHDATPFTFSEDEPAVDYFGRLLRAGGYNYYGTERMYSGATGVELEADIFFGVVYYQRLRHMVSDKFQVRSTGPIDILTHQPIKGRKRAGGIRFGEMERDSLLAHGTSFLLQDRLLNCSDKSMSHICTKCGTILGVNLDKPNADQDDDGLNSALFGSTQKWTCSACQSADNIDVVTIPYVFQYLVAELSAMNVKVKLDVK